MCPACIANITVMAAGATSGGGVAAFVFRSFYRSSKQIKTENNQNENQRSRKEKGPDESPRNRAAERVGCCAPTTAREGEEADPRDGRHQLIVYRAFFEPGVVGWPEHACVGCSMVADQVAHPAHLNARDTTLAFASRAPQTDIERLKARMGWQFIPWYTMTDGFDKDFGVDEWHGTNAFIRDGNRVFRTYLINNRGDEQMGNTWNYLDITALGRQEEWEDSPEGHPQTPPYEWWRWHDEYSNNEASAKVLEQVRRSGKAITGNQTFH